MWPLVFGTCGFGIALIGGEIGDSYLGVIGICLLFISLWIMVRQPG